MAERVRLGFSHRADGLIPRSWEDRLPSGGEIGELITPGRCHPWIVTVRGKITRIVPGAPCEPVTVHGVPHSVKSYLANSPKAVARPCPGLTWQQCIELRLKDDKIQLDGRPMKRMASLNDRRYNTLPRFASLRETRRQVAEAVARHPGISPVKAAALIDHHYPSDREAAQAIRAQLQRQSIPGVRATWSQDGTRCRMWEV